MTINVYWTCLENEWQRDREPEPIYKKFYQQNKDIIKDGTLPVNKCPFANSALNNIFQIRSIYSYSFSIDENNQVYSKQYDQNFFDKHLEIRSSEKKCFSFFQKRIFFTDERHGIDMTSYIFPYLEDNNVTERCIPIVGEFNIGKWFRPIEYPFFLKKKYNEFIIEEGEIYFYIKFNTEEKIKFIQFYPTQKIKDYYNDCINITSYSSVKGHDFFYKNLKIKNLILKEIKENII